MADQKISELNELTSPAPDDVLPIVDISASETKKITKANLFSGLSASDISISTLGTPTYNNVQDWFITTQSAGKISGGEITDNGDGTVSVSAGTGFIKTTDSDTGDLLSFDWSANNSVSLTDNDTNYIYVAYNGGSPIIQTATSIPSDRNTNVMLGLVYKEGTDLYIVTAGQEMANYNKKTLWKDIDVNGKFQHVSGLKISESGTRNIAISSGYIYTGLTKQSYSAFDSSGSDTFATFYRDGAGGWTKTTGQTQVDNQYYDDGSGTLASLSPNSYTCRYVYMDIKGNVYVLYGQAQYARLADAIEEDVPSSIPKILEDISLLLGKIIIKQGQTNFELVTSAFTSPVAYETVRDHDDLGGLQGGTAGEYYHLTNSQYTEATQYASSTQNGLLSSTDWNTFNNKQDALSFPLSPSQGGTGLDTSGSTGVPKITSGTWSIDATTDDLTEGTTNKYYSSSLFDSDFASKSIGDLSDVSISSPSDGQVLTYNGTSGKWENQASSGSSSPLTTKGDIYTYSTTDDRLPVGTDGQLLKADSSQSTGLAWFTPTYISSLSEDTSPQLSADLDANSHKITNLSDPVNAQDAATKNYVDTNAGGGTDLFGNKAVYSTRLLASMMGTSSSGSGSVSDLTGMGVGLSTGYSSSDSYAQANIYGCPRLNGFNKNMKVAVWIQQSSMAATSRRHYYYLISDNTGNPTSATKYAGFRIEGSTVYAVSKDGTTEESTDVTSYFPSFPGTIFLVVELTAGTSVKFYVNGTLAATHTTNIPPSSDTTTVILSVFRVYNNTDAAQESIRLVSMSFEREL